MYFADIASSLYFVLENCAAWGARSIMTEKAAEGNVEKEGAIAGPRETSWPMRLKRLLNIPSSVAFHWLQSCPPGTM
jgi:hypothetical protein